MIRRVRDHERARAAASGDCDKKQRASAHVRGEDCGCKKRGGRLIVRSRGQAPGFTLLEVLIAVFVFVIVGTLAMSGYNELLKQSEIVESSAGRTRAVQAAMQRIVEDFAMIEPRPVREPLGESLEPALRFDERTENLVEFTRSGWSNPAGVSRSTLQRVSYRVEDDKLQRSYWTALDRTLSAEPTSAVLLEGVREMSLRFMDQNQGWHEQWPPLGYSGSDLVRSRPVAVEITLELEDWGEIVRLVEVAG